MQIELDPEKDFHVAIDGVVTALSLDALDEAYQADSISDETLIWQEGLDEWMRLDVLLASLSEQEPDEAPGAPGPVLDENTYSVMVAPEDVRSMTLEVLGDAFRAGAVTEETLVWQPGYAEWVPLSVVIAAVTHQHVSLAPSLAPTQQGTYSSAPSAPRSFATRASSERSAIHSPFDRCRTGGQCFGGSQRGSLYPCAFQYSLSAQ